VQLAWTDNGSDEEGFALFRAEGASVPTEIATVGRDVTSYSDADVDVGVQYVYAVAARSDGGTSALIDASGGDTVGPAPIDTAVTGRLTGYVASDGAYAVASQGVVQTSDPGGGPDRVSFGDTAQYGTVDADGRVEVALALLADGVLSDFEYCGTPFRATFLLTLSVATVPVPMVEPEVTHLGALTNTGGRSPFFDARVGDAYVLWMYVPSPVNIQADCTGLDGISWHYQLDLLEGWNAVMVRVDAVSGATPTEQTMTTSTSGELVWEIRASGLP
jgi:hypothetical protein